MYLLTVITVVFNDSVNLEKTIKNVISQKSKSVQYIIIDGGSTDETLSIIKKYSKDIDKVVSEHDEGIYDAMNKGIKIANGYWVNFLNAGDLYSEVNFLEQICSVLKNTNSNLVNTNFIINQNAYSPNLDKFYLLRSMPCHQSLFYRVDLFENLVYDLRYRYCADFAHLVSNFHHLIIKKINYLNVIYLGGGFSASKYSQSFILKERLQIIIDSNLGIGYKILFIIINQLQSLKFRFCSFL